ncbi:MAG: type II secretion system protein [Alphaproteobacteria bacterium]|nr:type II secretion system protein [Alphaproteobacteria bacterium]
MRVWRAQSDHAGFTLAEMAMVMIIAGIVMLTIFPALTALRAANQYQLTQSNLHSLMLATAAYVQANGCVPCPASPGAVGAKFGIVGGTGAACGGCAASIAEGIAPFASLGIPASTAHDGWGHWITMRVDPALTAKFTTAPPSSSQGMCAAGLATSYRVLVTTPGGATQQAAVIFVSHGKEGYGSYFAQPVGNGNNGSGLPFSSAYAACSPSSYSGYAQCNGVQTSQSTGHFYDAQAISTATDIYDDILAYADRNTLVAMFGNDSCTTVW